MARAQTKIDRWLAEGGPVPRVYAERWDALLRGGVEAVQAVLTSDTPEAMDLRQNSPFSGIASPAEWQAIVRRVR
jgi:hypothetical protein